MLTLKMQLFNKSLLLLFSLFSRKLTGLVVLYCHQWRLNKILVWYPSTICLHKSSHRLIVANLCKYYNDSLWINIIVCISNEIDNILISRLNECVQYLSLITFRLVQSNIKLVKRNNVNQKDVKDNIKKSR